MAKNTFKKLKLSGNYCCPMIREDSFYPNEVEDIIEIDFIARPQLNGYHLIPKVPGYREKFFYSDYIEWLIHTGYIKEV